KDAVPALRQALKGYDPKIRAAAASVLAAIGAEAEQAVPELLKALDDGTALVQAKAALTLVTLVSAGVPGVLDKAREADRTMHWAQPMIRVPFGKAPADGVAALIKQLRDPNPQDRARAALALAQFGDEAKPAMQALARAVQDDD